VNITSFILHILFQQQLKISLKICYTDTYQDRNRLFKVLLSDERTFHIYGL